jgi:hypothetical protein
VIYDIHPGDDFYAQIQTLHAGDEVVVHAGTYTSPGFVAVTWAGTAAAPIVIHAAPGDKVILQGTFAQNLLNIDGSYWTLEGFEITGASHGLRLHAVDHATIKDNVIHDVGDVGISCNFEPNNCDTVSIIHNEIYRTGMDTANGATGEGMYLGCNASACAFTNGLIANNWVHDTGGSQGDGIEVKEGASGNVVRDNVIIRTPYPGITMYGYGGTGAANIVERNLIWHTMDNGIQIVGQIVVRNNIILDAAASGIASKPSQTYTPHDTTVVNTTVVGTATCIKTNNWATETGNLIANNALYCATALDVTGGTITSNVGTGTSNAASGFTAGQATDLENPAMGDVWPPTGSTLLGAGDAAHQPADDFNALPRTHTTVGAYDGGAASNPGWVVVEGFKTLPAQPADGTNGQSEGPTDPAHPPKGGGCCDAGASGSPAAWLLALLTWSSVRRKRGRSPRAPSRPRST